MAANARMAAVALAVAGAPCAGETGTAAANPIRKVVMMLQNMENSVREEGEKGQAAYDNFMCYCKTGAGELDNSISAGKAKVESLTAAIKAATEQKATTESDLKAHQVSRSDAKEAMAQASALRQKEAAIFAKFKSDSDANLAALSKAIKAISSGVGGSFLQSTAAGTLRAFVMEKAEVADAARQEVLEFLAGSQSQEEGYVPQSGEIIGILKQMDDQMANGLAQATADEEAATQSYESLMAAKTKEVNTLTAQIEAEMTRIGELGVEVATMENDFEDTQDALREDSKYLSELGSSCKTKTAEWEQIKATRAEELVALAETIKVLNDDDATELFKKTLPGASASFVELTSSKAATRNQALAILRAGSRPSMQMDLIALALRGKQAGFAQVVAMIDQMVTNLKKEQQDDSHKKEYCNGQIDQTEDKKKHLELAVSDSATAIDDLKGSIATLTEEIDALEDGIRALDKSVAEATDLRKKEHQAYDALVANDSNAKEVLSWAKNRLNKFYNPKLYKAPPKRDLSEEQDLVVRMGGTLAPTAAPGGIAGTGIGAAFVQISSLRGRPAAAPVTDGYAKKSGETTGVISMIDLLIKDLDTELQEAGVSERDGQADYETMMAEASSKRAEDSKALTDKEAAKAQAEEMLQGEEGNKKDTQKQLMGTAEYLRDLHKECDWLLKYFDARKEARSDEIDALGKAKAVLNGADFSLLQTAQRHGFLA